MADVAGLHVSFTANSDQLVKETRKAQKQMSLMAASAATVNTAARGFETQASKTAAQTANLAQTAKTADHAWARFSRGLRGTTKDLMHHSSRTKDVAKQQRLAAMSTANMTAQFNDLIVMFAANQNPMMTAVQQGTQMNQVFDMMNGKVSRMELLGAGLRNIIKASNIATFALIALGSVVFQAGRKFFTAEKDTKTWKEQLDEAKTLQDQFIESLKNLEARLNGAHSGFTLASAGVAAYSKALYEIQQIRLEDQIAGLMKALSPEQGKRFDFMEMMGFSEAKAKLREISVDLEKLINFSQTASLDGQVEALTEVLKKIEEARIEQGYLSQAAIDYKERVANTLQFLVRQKQAIQENNLEYQRFAERQRQMQTDAVLGRKAEKAAQDKLTDAMIKAWGVATRTRKELIAAGKGADKTANTYVDILGSEAGLKLAQQGTNKFYESRLGTLDDTFNTYVDIIGSEAGLASAVAANNSLFAARLKLAEQFGARAGSRGSPVNVMRHFGDPLDLGDDAPAPTGGGGQSPLERTEEDYERLRESLRTEREVEMEALAERQAILADARAMEIITETEHKAQLLRLEEQHAERMIAIKRAEENAKYGLMKTVLGNVASLMGTNNKKLFKLGKVAAIANSIINTHQGITNALRDYPAPKSFVVAAAVAAKGFASVRAIQSQQLGGGGGAAGAAGGGGATAASSDSGTTNKTYFNVSLVGGDQYGPTQIRDLIGKINEEIEDGAVLGGVRLV